MTPIRMSIRMTCGMDAQGSSSQSGTTLRLTIAIYQYRTNTSTPAVLLLRITIFVLPGPAPSFQSLCVLPQHFCVHYLAAFVGQRNSCAATTDAMLDGPYDSQLDGSTWSVPLADGTRFPVVSAYSKSDTHAIIVGGLLSRFLPVSHLV